MEKFRVKNVFVDGEELGFYAVSEQDPKESLKFLKKDLRN